ncbi:MAG: ATP synthase subunit I, partial [Actinomycetota bacterium]
MTTTAPDATGTRLLGPSPAIQVARDMAKRGVLIAPVFLVVGAIFWGVNGALSVGFALAIVIVNFLFAAALLGWSARISFGLMTVTSLVGFGLRLGLIALAIMAVRDMAWVELVPLSLTLIISHLGLLSWETRFVSASLAFPGLKPDDRTVVVRSVTTDT